MVVGTSGGAFVTALVRNEALTLDSLVMPNDDRDDVAERIRGHVFTKKRWCPGSSLGQTWDRPRAARPRAHPFPRLSGAVSGHGITDWVTSHIGEECAARWPTKPTAVVAFDIASRRRVVFGAESAPEAGIADAVAASSAIPLLFRPYPIDGRLYVDGGVVSGTHADVVLGSEKPVGPRARPGPDGRRRLT